MSPSADLDRVVLVTGAGRRIGRAIALELAGGGMHLGLHCRASAAEAQAVAEQARALGVRAEVFSADLADAAACEALVPQVLARMGRLDALVNNASLFEYDDALSASALAMHAHWRVNTWAPVALARALHAHVSARKGHGCVVNLLDQKLANPNPDYFSYTLSKAALHSATTLLAQALSPAVRVCGVAPGVTLASSSMSAQEFERAHALTPLQRSSTPQDIARAVRFLIESPAITGSTLWVDGGQHLQAQARDVLFLVRDE